MAPFIAVQSLRTLTLELVAESIATFVSQKLYYYKNEDDTDKADFRKDREFLQQYLPGGVRQDLLKILLENEEIEAAVRYSSLAVLLNTDVKSLSTETFPEFYYSRIVCVLQEYGGGLETLSLKGVWLKGKERRAFTAALKNMKNLKTLLVPYICDDDILETLGRRCPLLNTLDLAGTTDVTEQGIEKLCYRTLGIEQTLQTPRRLNHCCQCLQMVNLGGPGGNIVAPSAAAVLLKNLPNLVSLGGYPNTGAALLLIYKEYEEAGSSFRCNLKYIHDINTDSEKQRIMSYACPNLEAVYFDTPQSVVVRLLTLLRSPWKLKLHNFQCQDIYPWLEKCGHRLTVLELLAGKGTLDISRIAENCPKIEKLQCYNMTYVTFSSEIVFSSLTELGIYHSEMTTHGVRYLLSHCPNIRHFAIGEGGELNDEDFVAILSTNPFQYLEEFWIAHAKNLTSQSLRFLIQSCEKLKSVGRLDGWNMNPIEVEILRVEILLNNFDLVLWEYFLY